MEHSARGRVLRNQPYDESLELEEPEQEERGPSPGLSRPRTRNRTRGPEVEWSSRSSRGLMMNNSGSDEFDDEQRPGRPTEPGGGAPGGSPQQEEEEEEEEEDEEDSDEEDSDDDDEASKAPEGAYDPADYANLPVSTEIKELFQYITRYTPQSVELDHSLKPFIPDFIPAVGDIDAFLKVPRPDSKADSLGLLVLDEPSVRQSDPTVMSLWLSEETKQHGAAQLQKVSSLGGAQLTPRAVERWVDSISALHRSKPAASVQYGRAMPDIDSLMQEWPAELEELLGRLQLPPARLDCSPGQYADIVCCLLDIPMQGSRIQALHLLFSLYLEFRDSQHFTRRT